MSALWNWILNGGHVYLSLASMVIAAAIHFSLSKERTPWLAAELLLMYSIGIAGFRGIFAGFVMHAFYADALAESIGWPAGNPFQLEVAFANLAIGVLGALAFWRRDVWLPYIIAGSIFAWGAGITHVLDLMQHNNFAPNNAGPILYANFLVPVARILLYGYWQRGRAQEALRTQA